MARTYTRIAATPAEVFAVLADAWTYEHWVVGCADIRAVDAEWPAPGTRFHHTVGIGPFKTKDSTISMACEPYERLVLEARARPAGIARVIFTLSPVDDPLADQPATDVAIEEYPVRGPANAINSPLLDGLVHLRNAETLRRLEKLVLERGAARVR